jgi:cell division protein FtsN
VRDLKRDAPPASRWSAGFTGLDVFWPILGVILVSAVIFVAVVAHTSMDSVGAAAGSRSGAAPRTPTSTPTSTPSSTTTTLVIVQVSSHPTRAKAEAAAQTLAFQGFHPKILKSDDYSPLNRGFFVVYTGPYPPTENGRAAAKLDQDLLPGALIRDVRPR